MKLSRNCRRGALGVLLIMTSSLAWKTRADDGKELFVKICAQCHSKDGTAQTPAAKKLGVKDLSQSKLSDDQIEEMIREGKLDQKKESKMPAFKDKISAEELKSLVTVVKSFRK